MKAMIVGVSGLSLTAAEKDFIAENQPWAFILFARNIGSADEVKQLTSSLVSASGRDDVFIFIDQEGGRVQRLRAPLAPDYPPAATLGELYKKDKAKGLRATFIMSRLHAFDLRRLGINADCLPLLDVPIEGSDNVIGTRAYGNDHETVIALGRAAAEGLNLSKKVVGEIIRKEIDFDGLLMTDDLSMKALSGDLGDLAKEAFEAGCDLVLHCNGEKEEMQKIAAATPWLEGKSLERAQYATNWVSDPDQADEKALREEFQNLLALS